MNSPPRAVDEAALEHMITGTGVDVTAADVDTVARSLERIHSAAEALMPSLPFDETGQRFYRLLDRAGEANR